MGLFSPPASASDGPDITGTPVANQMATWSDANTLQASAAELTTAGALSGITSISLGPGDAYGFNPSGVATLAAGSTVASKFAWGQDAGTNWVQTMPAESYIRAENHSTRWYLGGGYGLDPSHGSVITLSGTSSANNGTLDLRAGTHASAKVSLTTNATERFAINNDGTVTVHATTAASLAGAMKLDDLATPDDNTDLNASTTRHGLLPKLSNVVTEFLTGTGTWAVPASGSSFVGCAVYKNATQSITAETWTAVSWPAEVFDSGTMHDNSTNNSRITVPTTGKYLFTFNMGQLGLSTSTAVKFYVNGTKRDNAGITSSNGYYSNFLSAILDLTASDYVQVYIVFAATGDINYDVNTTPATYVYNAVTSLSCVKVG